MSQKSVLKRFIAITIIAIVALVVGSYVLEYLNPPPGDLETRRGSQLLSNKDYLKAITAFDEALNAVPNHPGALMGLGIAHLQMQDHNQAQSYFLTLIENSQNLTELSQKERKTLAVAYNNLAISFDLSGEHRKAFDHYILALKIDRDVVDGPGIVDSILHGPGRSHAIERARYLAKQFTLPESERVYRVPEVDAEQRMYRP